MFRMFNKPFSLKVASAEEVLAPKEKKKKPQWSSNTACPFFEQVYARVWQMDLKPVGVLAHVLSECISRSSLTVLQSADMRIGPVRGC